MPDHIAGSVDELSEDECRILISPGGVGRIAYLGRFGLTVLPVNYQVFEDTIVFRTALDSPMGEDLRSGIANAEYKVAFEIDELDNSERTGWSVLLQGAAHHVDTDTEHGSVRASGVEPWAGGTKEHYIRIVPSRITGRRIRQVS